MLIFWGFVKALTQLNFKAWQKFEFVTEIFFKIQIFLIGYLPFNGFFLNLDKFNKGFDVIFINFQKQNFRYFKQLSKILEI